MKTADIALWTVSIFLSVVGIIFAFIAAASSTKANKKIESLIHNSFVADETQKYFFNQMKAILIASKKVITYLDSPKASYSGYSSHSTETRIAPLPHKTRSVLLTTEYQMITERYRESRMSLDDDFKKILPDLAVLQSKGKIDAKTKKALQDYHKSVMAEATKCIAAYTQLNSDHTRTMYIKTAK